MNFNKKCEKELKRAHMIKRLRKQAISIFEWTIFVITAYVESNLRTWQGNLYATAYKECFSPLVYASLIFCEIRCYCPSRCIDKSLIWVNEYIWLSNGIVVWKYINWTLGHFHDYSFSFWTQIIFILSNLYLKSMSNHWQFS